MCWTTYVRAKCTGVSSSASRTTGVRLPVAAIGSAQQMQSIVVVRVCTGLASVFVATGDTGSIYGFERTFR